MNNSNRTTLSKEFESLSGEHKKLVNQYTSSAPVQLGELARALGLRPMVSSLRGGLSGDIQHDGNTYTLRVNRHEARTRQRFTLAWLISQYLLNEEDLRDGLEADVLYRTHQFNGVCASASRLAADLIMPIKQINEALELPVPSRFEDQVEMLADHFEVSWIVMRIRLGID